MRSRSLLTAAFVVSAAAGVIRADDPGRRWIIDSAHSLAEAQASSGPGDVLVLRAGPLYAGPISLKNGQSLVGEGDAAAVITATGEGAAINVAGTSGAVLLEKLAVRAEGSASGIVLRDVPGSVTLRDVSVAAAGATALHARKVARLIVSGTSSVSSTGAAAIDIAESDLDATFSSVSASGPHLERAIVLRSTTGRVAFEGGTIEGASVRAVSAASATNVTIRGMRIAASAATNGVAAAACGGDLAQGKSTECNAAIHLDEVNGATLDHVVIDGSGQGGIIAHAVTDLVLLDSEVRNAGNELFEHGVILQEVLGHCRIERTTIERSASRHLMLYNSGGALSLVIDHCRFSDALAPHGQQALHVTAAKDAQIDLTVRDSTFIRNFSHAVEILAVDASKMSLQVTGTTFEDQATAVNISATGRALVDYVIADNPSIVRSTAAAINVYLGKPSNGRLSGTIARNVIGTTGVAGSGTTCGGCGGIVLTASGAGAFIAEVTGNIVQQTGGSAIFAGAGSGSSAMNLTMTSNLLRQPGKSGTPAIRVSSAGTTADSTSVCADLGGGGARANTIEGGWDPAGPIQLLHRFPGARFQLVGLTGGTTETAAAAAVSSRNKGTAVRAYLRPEPEQKGFEPAERCTMPVIPQ
jgi:hypothetical protein